jgi:nucleoside-diphosphate-sugar epimerase
MEAEQALAEIARMSGMSCFVLRPPLVYGPHVRGNFLALWRAVERGAPLPLGRIGNRRNLLYVGNLVHAIIALLDSPLDDGGTWLVADRESVSTPELVNRIAAALKVPSPLSHLPVPLLRARRRLYGSARDGVAAGRLARDRCIGAREANRTAAVFARGGHGGNRGMVAEPAGLTETYEGTIAINRSVKMERGTHR